MTLQEAKDYLNYGIKEGYFDEDILLAPDGSKWTDETLIKIAKDMADRGDARIESLKENDI